MLLIYKKTGKLRIALDYRSLNKSAQLDRFPLAQIDNWLDKLASACIFNKTDRNDAYHQVSIHPAD